MTDSFYTKMSLETKCPGDNGPTTISINNTAWDLDIYAYVEMFHTLAIGTTFSETVFVNGLIGYLEEHGYTVTKDSEEE